MMLSVPTRVLCRTYVTCSCENMSSSCRNLYVLITFTLHLVVFLSVLRPAVADTPCSGTRRQCHDLASKTIHADLVLEGRVDRVLSSSERLMIVRVLTVFKDSRLRRRATSNHSTRLRVAVDYSSLDDDDDDDDVDLITSPTSLTRGARLIVFLRHRDTDDILTYYVISGGRRRRRTVDLYSVSASPAAVTESARKTVKKYSKRRNGEYSHISCSLHSSYLFFKIYLIFNLK